MNDNYDFCPQCGSIIKDGVCMNCGFSVIQENSEGEQKDVLSESKPDMGYSTTPDADMAEVISAQETGTEASPEIPAADSSDPCSNSVQPPNGGQPQNNVQYPYGGQPQNGVPYPYGSQPQNGVPYPYGGQPQNSSQYPYGMPLSSSGQLNGQTGSAMGDNQPQHNSGYTGGVSGNNHTYTSSAPGSQPVNNQMPPYPGTTGNYGQQYTGGRNYYNMQGPGGWQNDYGRQNGYAQPASNKSGNGGLIAVIVILAVLLACSVFALIAVSSVVSDNARSASRYLEDSYREAQLPDNLPPADSNQGLEDEASDYIPAAEDEFYITLADSVRSDLSYQVEWEDYSYKDDETGASSTGRYPQLSGGNIPHLDKLNEELKNEATYYSSLYDYYKEQQYGESLLYSATSDAFVTYMDEDKMSIVFQERFVTDYESFISLYCINLDLVSGEKMDNSKIIQYSDQLVEKFRKQNSYQNGTVEAVDEMKDDQLKDFLADPQTNIIFYTPVGLELGFNYSTDSSSGWVTATLKDYQNYVTKY